MAAEVQIARPSDAHFGNIASQPPRRGSGAGRRRKQRTRGERGRNMDEMDLSALEAKVDELIRLCENLATQNKELREERQSLRAERARLMERNDQAKSKIDTMISRLKTLEEEV